MKSRATLFKCYGVATFLLAAWLFGSYYAHGMASFDCADRVGHRPTCEVAIQSAIETKALIGIAIWFLGSLVVAYIWKKR